MAGEFVDLYQILELPVETDREALRKRIGELYLDAQRNLDHRHLATRVKFQELFEVTLPQARYILLDDGRRAEYNRAVHAFRAAKGGGPPAPPSNPAVESTFPPSVPGDFHLQSPEERPQSSFSFEHASPIEPLPQIETDGAQLVETREELWKKWKTGLETALIAEADTPQASAAITAAPAAFSMAPIAQANPAMVENVQAAPAPVPVVSSAPAVKTAAPRPKIEISFDGDEKPAPVPDSTVPEAATFNNETESAVSPAEIEERRIEHRRQLTREVLVNVSLLWGVIGAALVVVPGLVGLIAASGHYYPRDARALLNYPPQLLWGVGLLLIGIAAFFASRELSSRMHHKKTDEFSSLSYEEFLKRIHRS